ncbi:hypothetical protein Tco_1248984 [Tanacetum coccineum]
MPTNHPSLNGCFLEHEQFDSHAILTNEKLTGPNFMNWHRNLKIALRYEKKLVYLEKPLQPAPDHATAIPEVIDAYYDLVNAQQEVAYLQKTLDNFNAYDMLQELKTMFKEQAKQELFKTVKAFHACKQVDAYVRLILNSLAKDYEQFIQNYNMHSMGKTIAELHDMLMLIEKGLPKKAATLAILAIRGGKIQKDNNKPQGAKGKGKGKRKLPYTPKPKIPPPPKRYNLEKDSICHHYKEGLRRSRKLKHGVLNLYMGNGMRATIEAIRSCDLILPSGLIIERISHKKTKNQARSDKTGHEMEKCVKAKPKSKSSQLREEKAKKNIT